jgi:hypothetical protein
MIRNPVGEIYIEGEPFELDRNWQWLASTLKLQTETYRYDYAGFDTAELANYIDWNLVAAGQELAEVREEISWKPWATDPPFVNEDRVLKEVVDALHFLGNILTAIGVTDAQFARYYQVKQEINRRRAASGSYSARKGHISEGSD